MRPFDHQRLDVYRKAILFVAAADGLVADLPRGRASLGLQLSRASTSIALNIAEGAGEYSPADKARFYRMALRSATECAAILDILGVLELVAPETLDQPTRQLGDIVAMLTVIVRRVLARLEGGGRPGPGPGPG